MLGIECSLLEIQKLAWFLERNIEKQGLDDPLNLQFTASKFGPYADRLSHLLNSLDGSYLHCDKRIRDASPLDVIWFDDSRRDRVELYLKSEEARVYQSALEATSKLIDGFQSPFGLELLATVDWLLHKESVDPTVDAIKKGLRKWPGGKEAGERKTKLFNARLIELALNQVSKLQTT